MVAMKWSASMRSYGRRQKTGAAMWWAGHSFGPRFVTDMVPFLVYFIPLNFLGLSHVNSILRKSVFSVALALFALVNLFTPEEQPAATWLWNIAPNNINSEPERA